MKAICVFACLLVITLSYGAIANRQENAAAKPAEVDKRVAAILSTLPGEWEFTLGKRTGRRHIRPLYEGLAVAWSEEFFGSEIRAEGLWGYDAKRGVFFSMGIHNVPGAYGLATGRLDATADKIVFAAETPQTEAASRSVFQLKSRDEFSYTALVPDGDGWKEAWTARFLRKKSAAKP